MKNIQELRGNIDAIDDQIAKLFVERMGIAKEIGKLKAENNKVVADGVREREIINRVTKDMPEEIKLYGKQMFDELFSLSKAYQTRFVLQNSKLISEVRKVLEEGAEVFPNSATVACQGVAGAYSQIATDRMFPIADILYFKDWDPVFKAVEKGLCDFGVLPIENSNAGSVNAVYDLMRKHNFYIVKSIKLRIQHYLLAKSGTETKDVKEIITHEQAVSQCSEFIKTLGNVKITVCENTAKAAELVADSERTDVACICSHDCAGIYGLSILETNVQNNENNYTRFIAIQKKLKVYENADKISIMANLPHEAGSLNKVLNRFASLGLNLTKLESRPMSNTSFEFAFYFDVTAKIEQVEVQNLLAELEKSCDKFVFLGAYTEL
jgi:chorismate mutase/prephenate dehydratase